MCKVHGVCVQEDDDGRRCCGLIKTSVPESATDQIDPALRQEAKDRLEMLNRSRQSSLAPGSQYNLHSRRGSRRLSLTVIHQ